jgi:hypothetical protein
MYDSEVIFLGLRRFKYGTAPTAKFRWVQPVCDQDLTFELNASEVHGRIKNVRARGGDVSEEEQAFSALSQ